MALIPNYARKDSIPQQHAFLYAAYGCAIGPMVAGLSILLAFAFTRDDKLVGAGIAMLAFGFAVVSIGFNLVYEYGQKCNRMMEQGQMIERLPRWPALLLLWLNFPAALVCAAIGIALM
jgi:hypothetical protein